MNKMKVEKFLDSRVALLQKNLEAFPEKFSENPAWALEWSEATFKEAAELAVLLDIKNDFKKLLENPENSMEKYIEHLKDTIVRKAQWVFHSTSPISNLLEEYKKVAMARFVDMVESF